MKENPFVFGSAVQDENFGGRKKEINELVMDLSSKTNLIIFAPRRYGKTSLMFEVMKLLRKKGIICVYVDMYSATDKAKFANILATAIAKAETGKIRDVFQTIKEIIPPVKLTIKSDGASEFGGGVELELSKGNEDIDSNLAKLYDLPEKIANKKNKKMVVIFDEFQEITKINGREIEDNIRSKIQLHKKTSYVFMGSQQHLINRMFNDNNRSLYKSGKMFHLGKISEEEFGKFIKKRFNSTDLDISSEIVFDILKMTQRHPYYTQQLCHEIWNISLCKSSKKITSEDVLEAKKQVMRNQNYAYTVMWDSIKGKQRILLFAMARSDEEIFSVHFRAKYNLGASSSVARAAEYLVERGIIEKNIMEKGSRKYTISDIFFLEWLRQLE